MKITKIQMENAAKKANSMAVEHQNAICKFYLMAAEYFELTEEELEFISEDDMWADSFSYGNYQALSVDEMRESINNYRRGPEMPKGAT